MPIKKGNQKQKQKQTVIVNINEKPKTQTRRRRKATAPLKQQQQHSNMQMFNPSIINKPSQINDDVKELLLKLGKAHQTNNDLISRVLAVQQVNPQNEMVIDTNEEATLPNRTNSSMSSHDAEMIRLRAITAQYAPFSFSNAEEQTEDINRVQNRMVAPVIPINAYIEQLTHHESPTLKQPPPEIHTEAGTSGTDPIAVVDYNDTLPTDQQRQPDAEVAKDLDEFFQYTKALGIMNPLHHQPTAPTLLEKAGYPTAQARFLSPEPPEAHAEPAVLQAESKKVNAKTHPTLQKADFKNASEAREAIQTWNAHQPIQNKINLTKTTAKGVRHKNIDELEASLTSKGLDFEKIKAFDAEHSTFSPPNTRSKK